jgi:hypothetical protein
MPEKAKPHLESPYIGRIDAARFACCSVQQIDKWISCDVLHPRKVGRKIILLKAELARAIETNGLPVMPRPKGKVKP